MDENDNNLKNIDEKETYDLVERDRASTRVNAVAYLFVAISLAYALHSVYSIGQYLIDDSVPLVNCPKTYALDAPVIMQTIRSDSIQSQDRWIRGFMRRFITSQFPRTSEDVTPFFKYVIEHSAGMVQRKYKSLLVEENEIKAFIGYGFNYRFYPKFTDGSELKIRKTDNPKQVIVEIDGFLVKKMAKVTKRYSPTMKYKLEIGTPTLKNPEGITVLETDIEQITDYISGTKEKL